MIERDTWLLERPSALVTQASNRLGQPSPRARVVLISLVGYLVLVVAGLAAAGLVSLVDGWMFDEGILVGDVADARTEPWTQLAAVVGNLTDTWTVVGCVFGAGVVLLLAHLGRQFTMLVIGVTLELATFLTISYIVDRPRPAVVTSAAVPSTPSMPSGHVAAAVVLYGAMAVIVWSLDASRAHRVVAALTAVTIAVLVGASRVYEGLHHPSDVVVGALVGAGSLTVAVLAAGQLGKAPAERHDLTFDIPRPSHVLLRNRSLVVVVAALGVVLGIVAAAQPDWLLAVDEPVARAIRGDELVGFFRFWTRFGSQQDMLLAAFALGVLLWRRCRPFAVAVPAAVVVGVILDVTLKVVVDRPRPPDPLVGTALGSFPSGHALTGVIFFGLVPPALWILLRRPVVFWVSVPLSFVAAVLVAMSRVYLGGHWPSDVLASALIGGAVLLGTELALGTHVARRQCVRRHHGGCPLHGPGVETT